MLRYPIRSDWPFYLLVFSYGFMIINMTVPLWFGDGVNIFATYSTAATEAEMIVDANKVYWSKTCFLFGTLLLMWLNVDIRAAAGLAAMFWAGSLTLVFGANTTIMGAGALGTLLVALQLWRGALFSPRHAPAVHEA